MRLHLARVSARSAVVLFLCGGFTWFVVASSPAPPSAGNAEEFYFHHDHIIGTSLDLWLTVGDEAAAETAERAILDEIERLRLIFSTYDPASEISKLNQTTKACAASGEMIEVLRLYEVWQRRSRCAFNGQLGELVRVWKEAEKRGREPDAGVLARIVEQVQRPGWQINSAQRMVTRLTDQPLNLNSIAKGYIIQKAAAAARARVPALRGLLLNLGGDMHAWGDSAAGRTGYATWTVGVQDPLHPEDNAPPLTRLCLQDEAVATSGGYERYYTIAGKRYSHLFDPRTGRPAHGVASATVIARDNVTANALATTLCVLAPEEGLQLTAATPGAECLLVMPDGREFHSAGFGAKETQAVRLHPIALQEAKPEPKAGWPEGYQVNLTITLPAVSLKRYRRPYVAVWLENADAKPVRMLTVWGNSSSYFKDLPQWWKFARNDQNLVKTVTRATRGPGKYQLVWDGKDDRGNARPQGAYTVFIEVHREHGRLVRQTGKIQCGAEPAQLTLDRNAETEATPVVYDKKK